jgi:fermentation-respiration switch protein FrsA (DUF1100 family)
MGEIETREIELTSGEVILNGELFGPAGGVPLVVMCHGIPLSHPDPTDPGYAGLARTLGEQGYATLFVNFRGTGQSSGNFCMGGWYDDLGAVMDYARCTLADNYEGLYIAGFSGGGALAIRYAAEVGGVDGVAGFAAPARLTEVFPRTHCMTFLEAAREIGIIKDLHFPPTPDWFYDDIERHDAIDFVSRVSPIPLLIVHGEEDETVPVEQGKALFEAAGEPKELCLLSGGIHRLRHDPRALDCFLEWLSRRPVAT